MIDRQRPRAVDGGNAGLREIPGVVPAPVLHRRNIVLMPHLHSLPSPPAVGKSPAHLRRARPSSHRFISRPNNATRTVGERRTVLTTPSPTHARWVWSAPIFENFGKAEGLKTLARAFRPATAKKPRQYWTFARRDAGARANPADNTLTQRVKSEFCDNRCARQIGAILPGANKIAHTQSTPDSKSRPAYEG